MKLETKKDEQLHIMDMLIEGKISKEEAISLLSLSNDVENILVEDARLSPEECVKNIVNSFLETLDTDAIIKFMESQGRPFPGEEPKIDQIRGILEKITYGVLLELIDGEDEDYTINTGSFEVTGWFDEYGGRKTIEFDCKYIMEEGFAGVYYDTLKDTE